MTKEESDRGTSPEIVMSIASVEIRRTMRLAVHIILLHNYAVFSIILPRKLEDVDNFNDVKSSILNEMLSQELSRRKCNSLLEEKKFEDVYFHMRDSKTAVHVQNPSIPSPKCMTPTKLTSDIFASRMDVAVEFPVLTVNGNASFRPVSQSEVYAFSVRLKNVSGSGFCFTRWTAKSFRLTACEIRYMKHGEAEIDCPGGLPVSEAAFARESIDKMWTPLTGAMNGNLQQVFNRLMIKMDVMKFLQEPKAFEKYQNYVIESTTSANQFVDSIMVSVRKMIREKFQDRFAIPDIKEGFEKKGIFVVWRGSFRADHGTVRGLSSVTRVGDTAFATDNASQTHFFGNLSFKRLNLHYERYKAEFMNIGPVGSLDTKLEPIRLHVHPYVNFNSGRIYLEEFAIEHVGELSVEVTGLGKVLNWVASRIATYVVSMLRERVLERIEKQYEEYIKSVLSGYTIDDVISGRAFETG